MLYFERYFQRYLSKHSLIKHTCSWRDNCILIRWILHGKNGQKNWNTIDILKAIKKNVDKNKEKEGIFCEAGAFYTVSLLRIHLV